MNNANSYTFYKLLKKLLKDYPKEDIFLRVNNVLMHPNKEIEYVKFNKNISDFPIEIMINFMGLQGNTSQLPSYILDKLSRNEDGGDGWSLFFDFFNHYLLWIFFEITTLNNYPKSFDTNFSDRISKILFSMLGINDTKIAKRYLPFAPLLLSLRRPKSYIERILQITFNLQNQLNIIENIPHQIYIRHIQLNKLGSKNHILGKNLILGKKFLSYQNKIAIYIKDIHYDEALKYFPNAEKYKELKESILFLTNNEFCVDLYLKIIFNKRMLFKLGDCSHSKLGWGKILGKKIKNYEIIHIKLHE
ncbi:type VI secretion system baseplate subunit TssG [Campylobacter volucris]|uniref:type VI secretion system baseplate subunit TssG n=1 Tax=Campylobacter volucris TaxID=1031542 RepID=UPI00189C61DB|nr:type VI secretion system baseplate subunit TssG [Campylobacter volucris]MBF7048941.1 type VI secretion system baseplate subunit TssG [Campylobacter volucris]MBF7059642.1 type VI secretion system baseplate subunit TssG [Campylobacter volucris]